MNDTGGPAFPFNWETKGEFWAMGATLRDYFAAKAMQGWLANSKTDYGVGYETLAAVFYGMADAMLKARETAGSETESKGAPT